MTTSASDRSRAIRRAVKALLDAAGVLVAASSACPFSPVFER
jgi:hypothetical protein